MTVGRLPVKPVHRQHFLSNYALGTFSDWTSNKVQKTNHHRLKMDKGSEFLEIGYKFQDHILLVKAVHYHFAIQI